MSAWTLTSRGGGGGDGGGAASAAGGGGGEERKKVEEEQEEDMDFDLFCLKGAHSRWGSLRMLSIPEQKHRLRTYRQPSPMRHQRSARAGRSGADIAV